MTIILLCSLWGRYSCHHVLVGRYAVSISQMTHDLVTFVHCCNICPPFLYHMEHLYVDYCLSCSLVTCHMFAFHYLFAIFYHFMVDSFFRPLWGTCKHHLKQIFPRISISSFWYFLLVLEVWGDPHNCLKLLLVRMSQDELKTIYDVVCFFILKMVRKLPRVFIFVWLFIPTKTFNLYGLAFFSMFPNHVWAVVIVSATTCGRMVVWFTTTYVINAYHH